MSDTTQIAPGPASLRELSPVKKELFERRLRGGLKPSASQQIPRRLGRGPVPLSFAQQRLWLINQLEPASDAYNLPVLFPLDGEVDVDALEKSLNEIVRRHDVLRTIFPAKEGGPMQISLPFEARELPVVDLCERSPDEKERETKRLIASEAEEPFDLERGPVVRWKLLRLSPGDYRLIVTMHHIVSDGWSMSVFFRELKEIYESHALPALASQYADYAFWQRQTLRGPALEEHLAYWKQKLAAAPSSIALPADHIPPSAIAVPRAGRQTIVLSQELTSALARFSREHGVSGFMTVLTAVKTVLFRWTQQRDLVVGTVTAGRTRREVENLIGCFMNFIPLRTIVPVDATLQDLLERVKTTVLEGQAHEECPFEKVVEALQPARKRGQNPIYNVALLFQNFPRGDSGEGIFSGGFVALEPRTALLDLRFLADETGHGLSLTCEYNAELFAASTIESVLQASRQTIETLIDHPQMQIADLPIISDIRGQSVAVPPSKSDLTLAIAATFTAEPLADSLRFWSEKLEWPLSVQFAPYNQVFQELLTPGSMLASNQQGMNVILIRFEDWESNRTAVPAIRAGVSPADRNSLKTTVRTGETPVLLEVAEGAMKAKVQDLVEALKTAASRSSIPWLVCACPPSQRALVDPARAESFAGLEQQLIDSLASVNSLHTLSSAELLSLYPVAHYDDPDGEELGHVPYTPTFFAALGSCILRKLHAIKSLPRKVIVLDCDQTLWEGICGEDGPRGVRVDESRRALQQVMRAQRDAGMLLCLCSKNSEEDVRAVFECCQEMALRPDDFAARRINWRPKSENLRSLAEELGLGLDAFILVDDNPVECAEVEASCPQVLTLALPEDVKAIPRFLEHIWSLDHVKLTAEDRQRAARYQENRRREELHAQSPSLADFLAGLNLQIEISGPTIDQLARVAQLTVRTNQFNFTTRRRTEGEVRQLRQQSQLELLVASVRDRFGDYGLVGVMIYEIAGQTLRVDTFLLSCRALGKGVEHRMLARLGEIGHKRGCGVVDIEFIPSARNKPARDFLDSVGGLFQVATNHFRIPTEVARTLAFQPVQNNSATHALRAEVAAAQRNGAPAERPTFQLNAGQIRWIALNASDPAMILKGIEARTEPVSKSGQGEPLVPPRTEVERQLCGIWAEVLHAERVGVQDDFFELGGSSLLAVQLLAQVRRATGQNLPLSALFQAPTIEQLARLIEKKPRGDSPLAALQPNGFKPPLILVHGAGGGILWGYANLASHLGSDQPVYAIEPQEKIGDSPTVPELASRYIAELRALQPCGPYYLGGYCFGGYLAYEMACQLHAQGEKIALLALIDATAPNGDYEKVRWWHPLFIPRFIRNLFYWLADFFELRPKAQWEYASRQFGVVTKKCLSSLRRKNDKTVLVEEYINIAELPENELHLWRLHLKAGAGYKPPRYPGRATLVRTRSQPLLSSFDPTYGWGALAGEGADVRIVPGSHEGIFKEPDVQRLAEEVKTCLRAAQANL